MVVSIDRREVKTSGHWRLLAPATWYGTRHDMVSKAWSQIERVADGSRARDHRLSTPSEVGTVGPRVVGWCAPQCVSVCAAQCGPGPCTPRPRPAALARSEWPGGDRTRVVRTEIHFVRTKIVKRAKSPFWPLRRSPAQAYPGLEGSDRTILCRGVRAV